MCGASQRTHLVDVEAEESKNGALVQAQKERGSVIATMPRPVAVLPWSSFDSSAVLASAGFIDIRTFQAIASSAVVPTTPPMTLRAMEEMLALETAAEGVEDTVIVLLVVPEEDGVLEGDSDDETVLVDENDDVGV